MSCLKLQVSFSLNFASLVSILRDNSSILLLAETVHDLDQTFVCSGKISPNLHFNRLLLLKIYTILAEKVYTDESCLTTLKIGAKFEEKLICCFKNDRNLVNFDPSTRSLNNLHFHWFLWHKVFNV